ncbi:hypothetical protein [Pararobbsia alpina]|uniref:hypothetical protein n=1 Tax=Pararobbsia alpina TaxID=621374 RepID=UPI0039A44274
MQIRNEFASSLAAKFHRTAKPRSLLRSHAGNQVPSGERNAHLQRRMSARSQNLLRLGRFDRIDDRKNRVTVKHPFVI